MNGSHIGSLFVSLFIAAFLFGGIPQFSPDPVMVEAFASDQANMIERLQQKAAQAKALIIERAQSGRPVSTFLERMEAVKRQLDAGNLRQGETMLDHVLADLGDAPAEAPIPQTSATGSANEFGNPQPVEIRGYDSDLGAMEPFITRDSCLLLFNNAEDAFGKSKANPDLHYARRIDDRTFEYLGEINGANSKAMDGAPSMDKSGNLFFTSTRQYDRELQTLFTAQFVNGRVLGPRFTPGNISKRQPGELNMDGEISASGETLYFSDNIWDVRNNIPATSRLVIARKKDGAFQRDPRSDEILRNVNSGDIVYAPATSPNELELYFTKIRFHKSAGKLTGVETAIYVATRTSTDESFNKPKRIDAISGFVEGPTITSDGRRLYYHRKDGKTYRLYTVSRPDVTPSGEC